MIEVKNRSLESWGPLAKCADREFNSIINDRRGNTKDLIKDKIKKQKKMKPYRVRFLKESFSDYFEIEAENEYDVSSRARAYFKKNADTIEFKESNSYIGYDRISYTKIRS